MSVRLDDFGDVLTLADLGRLVGRGPRFFERFVTLERQTGVKCLPAAIPGLGHRYTKDAVRRWLRVGVPRVRRRAAA